MTRREEIVKATKECREYYVGLGRYLTSDDIADTFEEGAEWADKTMIEKAWDWFYNMALDYMSGDITDVKWGSMKEDFFKAMEE